MTALTMRRVRDIPFLRALATRDFRLLWGSEAISVVGDQFHFIALSWFVISLTGSGLALGTVLIAIAVPRALLLLPFGVLADRRPSRGLMLVAHLIRGAVVGAIAALVHHRERDDADPRAARRGLRRGGRPVHARAQQAFLPRTLEPERLPSGNALLQGTMQLSSIVGPPIAGAVIAVTSTGSRSPSTRLVRARGRGHRDDRAAGRRRPRRDGRAGDATDGPGHGPAEARALPRRDHAAGSGTSSRTALARRWSSRW